MMKIEIYGIKNCDTMKKAFKWLEDHNVEYVFHDYKKQGINPAVLARAMELHGWENVINRRGTTWRALDEDVKNTMNAEKAMIEAEHNPSLIKRPLILWDEEILLGFDDESYKKRIKG